MFGSKFIHCGLGATHTINNFYLTNNEYHKYTFSTDNYVVVINKNGGFAVLKFIYLYFLIIF